MARTRTWLVLTGVLAGAALGLVVLRHGERRPDAVRSMGPARPRLLPEADGALAHVALHWVPNLERLVEDTYRDFLAALPPEVMVTLLVPEPFTPADRGRLDAFLGRVDPKLGARVRTVAVAGPITTWSKDRALVTAPAGGVGRLIVPAEPGLTWRERHNDWATVERLVAESEGRFSREIAPFDFDAGDFAVASGRVLIDTNLLEKNRHRGYTTLRQLSARVSEYFAMPVVGLGQEWGDTPRHHLAMYLTPLRGPTVLVGDPRAAERIVGASWTPGENSPETDTPLVADFSAATVERFERAARELESQGFQVVRIPNVPFDDKTYIAYTNGVYEVRGGRQVAYMPTYDVPELDRAASSVYERLGWQVERIRVRRIYRFHGTIGCVVNVLGRAGSSQARAGGGPA
jgi:hypothetical protein